MFTKDFYHETGLVLSDRYADVINKEVIPYLQEKEQVTMLNTDGNTELYCAVIPAAEKRGSVVLVHGFTENAYKFAELIFSLHRNGYSVLAYDQRGHGRSSRASGLSDLSVTHVDHFSDYVSDLKAVTDHFLPVLPKPWMVFAHSMGGAVTSLFLENHQEVFAAAVLSSPMIAPNTGVPRRIAHAMALAEVARKKGKEYPPFMKPYSGPEDFGTSCATDRKRFEWYDAVKASNPLFQNSIPSCNWVLESIRVTRRLLAKGAPERIACPVLLFSADQDYSVMPKPQIRFIGRVPKGKRIFVPGSRHEIYRSENDVMIPWWTRVLDFYHNPDAVLKEDYS